MLNSSKISSVRRTTRSTAKLEVGSPRPSASKKRKRSEVSSLDTFGKSCLSSSGSGYDEVFSPRGSVRSPYEGIVQVLQNRTVGQMQRFRERSLVEFHGDNVLVPVPRMLRKEEIETLRNGVQQRGRALRAFLDDYYSGTKSYRRAGLIPESVLQEILKRNNEDGLDKWLDSSQLGFWYGPDIIRDSRGEFRIIEDNPGYVGGMGDLQKAKKIMFKNIPELRDIIDSPDPTEFYTSLVANYRKRCVGGSDQVVLVRYGNDVSADNEDQRLQAILEKLGVETVVLRDNPEDGRFKNSLEVRRNGVYLKTKGERARKVGFVIAGLEPSEIDPAHPAVYSGNLRRLIADEIEEVEESLSKLVSLCASNPKRMALESQYRELKSLLRPGQKDETQTKAITNYLEANNPDALEDLEVGGIPGLLDAFYNGQVGMNNAPGAEFIGDKELYMYVDKMVEFYLKEAPVIKNLPTRSFRSYNEKGDCILDRPLFEQVFDNATKPKNSYVIKRVDGRGGKAVWVGAKMKKWEDFAALKSMVQREPSAFIVQEYTPLSQVDGHLVDLRLLSDVNPIETIVAPVPWGRAVRAKGSNGKVNISDNGGEQVVMISSTEPAARKTKRARVVTPTLASTRSRRSGIYSSAQKFTMKHNDE